MNKYCIFFMTILITSSSLRCFSQRSDSSCIRVQVADKGSGWCRQDLLQLPRDTVEWKDHDGKKSVYTGVSLQVLLERAGATKGNGLRGEQLRQYVLVSCADGYSVLFSMAELDADFGHLRVLLADTIDGHELAGDKGPFRLVVPGDRRAARSAYRVRTIVMKKINDN